jgi:hypothetical protein
VRTIYSNYAKILTFLMLATTAGLLAGLAGCGASGPKASTATAAGSITLTAVPATVKSDGTSSTIITATVLNSGNTVLSGQSVVFSVGTGQLSSASGVTDTNGAASAVFSAGPSGVNRTAVVTATSGTASGQIPVQIVGTTITASTTSASVLDNGSSPVTVTFTAVNPSGGTISGAAISVTKTGTGNITFTPASGYTNITDSNGQFKVTVAGVTGGAGVATLTAVALGANGSIDITVSAAATAFSISGLTLSGTAQTALATNSFSTTSMTTTQNLLVTVTAPSAANVWFATDMGVWNGTSGQLLVPAAGTASATLTTTLAGLATIQVYDAGAPASSDTLQVAMTAVTPYSVTLQASPSVVAKGSKGTSTLIATVKDVLGQPVGGAPVAFSIVNPTGGGETVSPVVAFTATTPTASLGLGQASTQFTAGSSSSNQSGVLIRAHVLGAVPAVQTGTIPSGNDAAVVIGGSPSSVAFGQATELGVNSNKSQYILAMSVIVSDSNGNPAPQGTVVTLALWPIAWSTGKGCSWDPDGFVWNPALLTPAYVAGNGGTFYNEDINENLILDPNEDGRRYWYADNTNHGPGTKDTYLTPANSDAGTIPATVTTDASGTATFDLIYPKTSALYVVDRIRGTTVVQGTAAVGEAQFRLGALRADLQPCALPDSHFKF